MDQPHLHHPPHKKHSSYGMILGAVSVILIVLIGMAVLTNRSTDYVGMTTEEGDPVISTTPGLARQAFTSDFAGFSIHPPSNWTIDRNVPTIHVNFIHSKADTDAIGPFKANINVATQVADGVSLDEFMATTKTTQQTTLTNYQEVSDRKVSVGGIPGRLVEFTFLGNNHQLHVLQLITIHNNNAYIVTATALDGVWSTYQTIMKDSLLSLTLKKI